MLDSSKSMKTMEFDSTKEMISNVISICVLPLKVSLTAKEQVII